MIGRSLFCRILKTYPRPQCPSYIVFFLAVFEVLAVPNSSTRHDVCFNSCRLYGTLETCELMIRVMTSPQSIGLHNQQDSDLYSRLDICGQSDDLNWHDHWPNPRPPSLVNWHLQLTGQPQSDPRSLDSSQLRAAMEIMKFPTIDKQSKLHLNKKLHGTELAIVAILLD